MKKDFDTALRHALTPTDEPDYWLNQNILCRVKEQNVMIRKKKRRLSVVAMIAALVLCMGSLTVYAAWKYLPSADVVKQMQDFKLAEAFMSEQALMINETQTYGGYQVTLLSIISGELLTEYPYYREKGTVLTDRTYVVVAIENEDGTPMPDISEESYGQLEFFVSPLIGGYAPTLYNIASMGGNYAEMTEDGILYRLLECDNIEIFAANDLYLCINEGMFYNAEAYEYDESNGEIRRNKAYEGLNALFTLPLDTSKSDLGRAEEYIAGLGLENDVIEEKLNVEFDVENFVVEGIEATEEGLQSEQMAESGRETAEDIVESKEGKKVVEYALQFVGNPYAWGCDSLTEGTDSSGFTKSVYEHFEITLAHDSKKQMELGTAVESLEEVKPGDLVFYETPSHVAIYIGDGKIVHAMSRLGICVSEVDFDDILCIRRMLNK